MKRTATAVLAIGLLLAACSGDSAESVSVDARAVSAEEPGGTNATTVGQSGVDEDSIGGGSPDGVLAGRKIIRQGSLVLQDDDPEAVFQRIVVLVEGAGGFVASSNLQRTDDEEPPRIEMTVRLPSGRLSATITAIANEAGEVLSRQLGSSDVTAQYVDIEARLRNLESLESELLLLLTEVRDVTDPEARDLLLVFDRLQSVRLEIEQLVGQKQAIDDQVDLATLQVTVVPTAPEIEITDDSWNPGDRIRESLASLVDVLENLANLAIWAGVFLLPVLALLAIPLAVIWWLATRRSRRMVVGATTPTTPEGSTDSGRDAVDDGRTDEDHHDTEEV